MIHKIKFILFSAMLITLVLSCETFPYQPKSLNEVDNSMTYGFVYFDKKVQNGSQLFIYEDNMIFPTRVDVFHGEVIIFPIKGKQVSLHSVSYDTGVTFRRDGTYFNTEASGYIPSVIRNSKIKLIPNKINFLGCFFESSNPNLQNDSKDFSSFISRHLYTVDVEKFKDFELAKEKLLSVYPFIEESRVVNTVSLIFPKE